MSFFYSLLSGAPLGNKLKVYIFTFSQSNMGAGSSVGLPAQYLGPLNPYTYNEDTGAIERLEVDVNNNQQDYPNPTQVDGIGPELVSAIALGNLANNRVLIIKYLVVGTSITQSTPNWSLADNTLYPIAKNDFVINALAAAETFFSFAKADIEIKGIIRVQGEADAEDTTTSGPVLQELWKDRHAEITNDLLTTLATAGYTVNTCRLITPRIHTWSPPRPKETEIRAATVDFGDNYLTDNELYTNYVAGTSWIDTDDLPTSDGTHWTQAGQLTLGQRVADDLTPYINEQFVPTGSLLEEGVDDQDLFEDGSTDIYENRLI